MFHHKPINPPASAENEFYYIFQGPNLEVFLYNRITGDDFLSNFNFFRVSCRNILRDHQGKGIGQGFSKRAALKHVFEVELGLFHS